MFEESYLCAQYYTLNHQQDLPPPFKVACSLRFTESRYNIYLGKRGQIGQLNEGKRDKIEEIGGWNGQCVNNFITDYSSGSLLFVAHL